MYLPGYFYAAIDLCEDAFAQSLETAAANPHVGLAGFIEQVQPNADGVVCGQAPKRMPAEDLARVRRGVATCIWRGAALGLALEALLGWDGGGPTRARA